MIFNSILLVRPLALSLINLTGHEWSMYYFMVIPSDFNPFRPNHLTSSPKQYANTIGFTIDLLIFSSLAIHSSPIIDTERMIIGI